MVMFKRRKVEITPVSPSLKVAPNTEVWEITQTGELFTSYEAYLERRDFYWQKHFVCEVTGHSNLTFFEAYDSETATYRRLDTTFPEPLREPILKRVQFSLIGRLEHLVNATYDMFKGDFFPKEHVIAILDNGDKADGVVREKTTLNDRYIDGVHYHASSRYLVSLEADASAKREAQDVLVEGENIYRDRRVFSKLLLKSFLKGALQKESWHGAPWTVKPQFAMEYNISMEIPPHLQQRAITAERKNMFAMQKSTEPIDQTTFFNYLATRNQRPLEVRPPPGGKGGKNHRFVQQDIGRYFQKGDGLVPYQITPDGQYIPLLPPGAEGMVLPGQPLPPGMVPMPMPAYGFPPHPFAPPPGAVQYSPQIEVPPTPPPPPPIKFPCEDTEVPPRKDVPVRPTLHFYSADLPSGEAIKDAPHPGLEIASVGTLLEIWDSLNVHSEVFILDSFTIDDFAEAMRFESSEVECELLNEVHCAVLKQLVNEEGKVQISLPDFDPAEEDEEEEEGEEDEEAEPTPEPEYKRTTRSSLRKEEAAALKQPTPTPEPTEIHQAAAMQGDRPWVERLKARDFKDGGWQVILVGLLHQISLMPRKKDLCDKILSILAPMDMEPTAATAKSQYFEALNVNFRLEVLQIITQFSCSTPALRKHLEDMSSEMTELRKRKIEQQRMKKDIIDELHKLDLERKELAAEIQAKKPESEKTETNGADVDISDLPAATNGIADSRENSDDDAPPIQLRRGPDRKRKREEDAARREKAKKEKASQPKRTKEEIKLEKLIDEIETRKADIMDCEEKIGEYTNDLRETDCQRLKCLGRDRFCNRYWWFERNGMPFGGVPHTSTAHYNYASGRIWVQGPDENDRMGLIDLDKDLEASYVQVFDMTMLERKELEEGETHLESAEHWAYIDSPEKVEQLMGWLDDRGLREKALKKELIAWREIIVDCMAKMRSHLDSVAARKLEAEEDEDEAKPTRVSTRTKTYVEFNTDEWPCLQWRNSLALEQFGMIHSEGVKKKRKGVAEKKEVKLSKKDQKLVTRTGASYGRR